MMMVWCWSSLLFPAVFLLLSWFSGVGIHGKSEWQPLGVNEYSLTSISSLLTLINVASNKHSFNLTLYLPQRGELWEKHCSSDLPRG